MPEPVIVAKSPFLEFSYCLVIVRLNNEHRRILFPRERLAVDGNRDRVLVSFGGY